MVFSSPVSLHLSASSIADLIACADSGAGAIPSLRANATAASNTSTWWYDVASMIPSDTSLLMIGDTPWYLRPPAWIAGGMNSEPSVYIFKSGVCCAMSPKSYLNSPDVRVGHADGSTAMNFVSVLPARLSLMYGRATPARLLPPPQHPITMSG